MNFPTFITFLANFFQNRKKISFITLSKLIILVKNTGFLLKFSFRYFTFFSKQVQGNPFPKANFEQG